MNRNHSLPRFRTRDLVIQELPDEVLIYDLIEHKAFCLNSTARSIMDVCDGEMSIDEALNALRGRLGSSMPEEIVWMTVSEFKKSRLLDDEWSAPVEASRISRRKVLNAAVALGIALPIVSMLVAPTAAAAQSSGCVPLGSPCTFGESICCQGFCCVNPQGPSFPTCNNNCIA